MDIDLKQPDWVTEAENNNEWFPPEPDEETELINFLLSPYLTSHICCGNYEAMKRVRNQYTFAFRLIACLSSYLPFLSYQINYSRFLM